MHLIGHYNLNFSWSSLSLWFWNRNNREKLGHYSSCFIEIRIHQGPNQSFLYTTGLIYAHSYISGSQNVLLLQRCFSSASACKTRARGMPSQKYFMLHEQYSKAVIAYKEYGSTCTTLISLMESKVYYKCNDFTRELKYVNTSHKVPLCQCFTWQSSCDFMIRSSQSTVSPSHENNTVISFSLIGAVSTQFSLTDT